MRVLTYNIRSARLDPWPPRRSAVMQRLLEADADIVGLQEALSPVIADILRTFPRYRALGRGRDRFGRGEHCALLVDDQTFDVTEGGALWLSPRPHRRGWDARCKRLATWAGLRERAGGGRLTVYDAHLDHVGPVSRIESARLIAAHAAGRSGVIVAGDLNARPGSDVVQAFGLTSVHDEADLPPTHGAGRIDHVLHDAAWELVQARVLTDDPGSDHKPLLAVFRRASPRR